MVAPLAPVFQVNVLLPVPPLAETVMLPLDDPQDALLTVPVIAIAAGAVSVKFCVLVQPFASVAVTVYVPAVRLLMLAPLAPVFQVNVLDPVPPVAETEIEPLLPLLQVGLFVVPVMVMALGALTVKLCD